VLSIKSKQLFASLLQMFPLLSREKDGVDAEKEEVFYHVSATMYVLYTVRVSQSSVFSILTAGGLWYGVVWYLMIQCGMVCMLE
jgi:hypothetical protein